MQFQQELQIHAPPDKVWGFLWDVPQLAACIPGCSEAHGTEDPKRYAAVVGERVGPFQVRFNLDIHVTEVEELRRIRAVAQGKDSRVASHLKVDLEVQMTPAGDGATTLHILTDVNVFGKLGSLGHGIIQRKGQEIMERFGASVKAQLEAEAVPA